MEKGSETTEQQAPDEASFTNMSGEWMPWAHGFAGWRSRRKLSKQEKKKLKAKTNKKEYRAAVAGMYLAMLPAFLCVLAGFGLVYLLIRVWLM